MALTAQQKTEIFQLTQTMFNAAPGTQFFTLFENYIAATGASAREFAIALAGTPAFRQVMYADSLSSSAFASQFMDNLVGSTVATAHKAGVANVIVNLLGQGVSRGEVIHLATSALASISSDNPDWGAAAAQLRNKVAVAEYYTTTKGGAAVDLSTIQAVTAGVTDSAASVTAAKARLDGTSGRVADGYIKNATVFADLNGDGVQNAGEIGTTTDNFGNFTLTGTAGFGRIVVSGGTDISTNLPFNGTLTATAGATVVNPLTTLVQTMVESGRASSAEAAQNQVLTALGISTDVDLSTFDPLDAALNGDDAAARALGAQVQAAAAQVANIMVQGAAVLQGGNGTLSAAEAMAMVAESLANALDSASGAVDLAQADFMESMMTEAAQAAGMDAAEIAMLDDVASAMADAAAAIDEALAANPNDITAALSAMAQAQIVAQGDMADAMLDAITAGDFSDVMETFTGDAFDDLADAADAGTLAEGVDADDGDTVVTPPAGGGGGGGSEPAAATFVVTEGGAGVFTVSTGNGNVTVTSDGADYTFTPTTGTAVTVAVADVDSLIVNTITLTGTAAHLTGETITGTGTVEITALEDTLDADLSAITADTVTATVTTADSNLTFTGKLGHAVVSISGPSWLIISGSADMGTATFNVLSDGGLFGHSDLLSGKTINGAGVVTIMLASDSDTSNFADSLAISGLVADSVDISNNTTLGEVDIYQIQTDQTLTLTSAQADGHGILDGSGMGTTTGHSVIITGSDGAQTLNVVTTGTNSITPGAGADQITLGSGTGTDTVVVGGADGGTAEVQTIDLATASVADGETLTITQGGNTLTYTNGTGGAVAGADLATAVRLLTLTDFTVDGSGTNVTLTHTGTAANVAAATLAGTGFSAATAGTPEVQTINLATASVADGETLTITQGGNTLTYTNGTGGAVAGADLATAVRLLTLSDFTVGGSGTEVTLTQTGTPSNAVAATLGGTGFTAAVSAVQEVQTIDLATASVADGETLTITQGGNTLTYTNGTGGAVAGADLATAVRLLTLTDFTVGGSGTNVTLTHTGTAANVAAATLAGTGFTAAVAEVQTVDLTSVSLADGETITFTFGGNTSTHTNNTGSTVSGNALATAIASGTLTVSGSNLPFMRDGSGAPNLVLTHNGTATDIDFVAIGGTGTIGGATFAETTPGVAAEAVVAETTPGVAGVTAEASVAETTPGVAPTAAEASVVETTQGVAPGTASDSTPVAGDFITGFELDTDKLDLDVATVLDDLGSTTEGAVTFTITDGVVTVTSTNTLEDIIGAVGTQLGTQVASCAYYAADIDRTIVFSGDGVSGFQDSDVIVILLGVQVTDLTAILV